MVQSKERVVLPAGLCKISALKGLPHGGHGLRSNVGGHGDDAAAAQCPEGEGREIVAGEHAEILGAGRDDFGALDHVASGFLDAGKVGKFPGKPAHHRGEHVAARAARHVVGDNGNVHGSAHCRVVVVEAFLGRLVVVGGDEQGAVGAGFLGKEGQADGFGGVVGTGACQNLDAALDLVHADFDDTFVLVVGKGGGFACGSARNKTLNAFLYLPVDKGTEGFFIHIAILEGRDNGCENS